MINIDQHFLKIRVVGCGYGESILVSIADKFNIAIDSNNTLFNTKDHAGNNLIDSFILDAKSIFDFWILTHFHFDHYQSLSRVLQKYNILKVVHPDDNLIQDYRRLIGLDTYANYSRRNIAKQAESEYDIIKTKFSELKYKAGSFGNGCFDLIDTEITDSKGKTCDLKIRIYAMTNDEKEKVRQKSLNKIAESDVKKSTGKLINFTSYIVLLKYGNFEAIFFGDAPMRRIKSFLQDNPELRPNFVKMGHHGSKTSNNKKLVNSLTDKKLQTAVTTPYNSSGLPRKTIIDLYNDRGFNVYVTSDKKSNKQNTMLVGKKVNNLTKTYKIKESINVKNSYVDFKYILPDIID